MHFFKSWLKFGSETLWMNQGQLAELVFLPQEVLGSQNLKFTFQLANGDFKFVICPNVILDPFYFWKTQASQKDLLVHGFDHSSFDLGGCFPGVSCHLSENESDKDQALSFGVADFAVKRSDLKSELTQWELVQVEEWTAREPYEDQNLIRTDILFLDRDNVIVHDVPYNKDPQTVVLMEGISSLLEKASEQGFLRAMVSNQSGVGRGLMSANEFWSVQRQVLFLLTQKKCHLEQQVWAFFHESSQNPEMVLTAMKRKPRGGMFWEVEQKFILGENSLMVGDKASDLIAAYWGEVPRKVLLSSKDVKSEREKLIEFQKIFSNFEYVEANSLREVLDLI